MIILTNALTYTTYKAAGGGAVQARCFMVYRRVLWYVVYVRAFMTREGAHEGVWMVRTWFIEGCRSIVLKR